jgi:hypothetical protein
LTNTAFGDFIEGKYVYGDLFIIDNDESVIVVKHPYFKNQFVLRDESEL